MKKNRRYKRGPPNSIGGDGRRLKILLYPLPLLFLPQIIYGCSSWNQIFEYFVECVFCKSEKNRACNMGYDPLYTIVWNVLPFPSNRERKRRGTLRSICSRWISGGTECYVFAGNIVGMEIQCTRFVYVEMSRILSETWVRLLLNFGSVIYLFRLKFGGYRAGTNFLVVFQTFLEN